MTTIERLTHLIADVLDIPLASIRPEAHISNDLGLDSLDHIDLICAIEEEFDVEILDPQYHRHPTVQSLAALIDEAAEQRLIH